MVQDRWFLRCRALLFLSLSWALLTSASFSQTILNSSQNAREPKKPLTLGGTDSPRLREIERRVSAFKAGAAPAQIFTVVDAGDSPDTNITDGVHSPATFRAAIENANLTAALDNIIFAPGMVLIQPLDGYPAITYPVLLDGHVGTGDKVIFDGSSANPATTGFALIISGTGTLVKNIEMRNFPNGGIRISSGLEVIIQGNFIHHNGEAGISLSGTSYHCVIGGMPASERNYIYGLSAVAALSTHNYSDSNAIIGNYIGTTDGVTPVFNSGLGIKIETYDNFIYGNLVGADSGNGIEIYGFGNVIESNYVGVAPDGVTPIGNLGIGIAVYAGGQDTVRGNLVSGNGGTGIQVQSDDVFLQNNYVGTTAAGDTALGNGYMGIHVFSGANARVEDNLISGNGSVGLQVGTNGLVARNNIIGTNLFGSSALGNGSAGVNISFGANNTIGGPLFLDGNLISGNVGTGVGINGFSATGNTLMNNLIGTDVTGMQEVGNLFDGVAIEQGASGNVLHWNVISGNAGWGVLVSITIGQIPSGNIITGNTIGLDIAQNDVLSNNTGGISLDGARNTVVGRPTVDSANVISGNIGWGIYISGLARENEIRHNLIGTSGSGNRSLPNGIGILITGSLANTIGGSFPGSGNLVSGNISDGIRLENSDSNNIQGNTIGLNEQHTQVLGNGGMGIHLDQSYDNLIGSVGNTIGGNNNGIYLTSSEGNRILGNDIGTALFGTELFGNLNHGIFLDEGSTQTQLGMPGAGNTIAFNGGHGVTVAGTSKMNALSGNFIYSNSLLGIDLGDDWITFNDVFDPDSGSNNLQNFPVISLAEGSAQLRVYGELKSAADASYRVEFFANPECDSGDHGEGEIYLGFTNVTTNLFGNSVFTSILPVTVPPGQFITATATDSAGNTSEFSRCTQVIPPGAYADIAVAVSDSADTTGRGNSLSYRIVVRNNGPDVASGIILRDSLSSRVSYISDSTTHGTCTYANGVLSCTMDSLAVGEEAHVVVNARADSLGSIYNMAVVFANEADFNLQNNLDSDTTIVVTTVSVDEKSSGAPTSFALLQNYPNPFNPKTDIRFQIADNSDVVLKVYDMLGREVATLVAEVREPGFYSVSWDAHNIPSGIYLVRLRAGTFSDMKKIVLLK